MDTLKKKGRGRPRGTKNSMTLKSLNASLDSMRKDLNYTQLDCIKLNNSSKLQIKLNITNEERIRLLQSKMRKQTWIIIGLSIGLISVALMNVGI